MAPNLFDRLQFVIMVQDWEAMSGGFWLKTALDLLLAALREDDLIMLAPNSSQVRGRGGGCSAGGGCVGGCVGGCLPACVGACVGGWMVCLVVR